METPIIKPDEDVWICKWCENEIEESDEFCPNCGTKFKDDAFCTQHHNKKAEGVCIICCEPFCVKCGGWINDIFLCELHANYEIYQGMARIYGVLDDNMAQFVQECLKQAGLHPFIYFRHKPLGGPRIVYTLFGAGGDYDGHIVNEVKVMVPCQEVIEAEKVLKELKIKK